MSVPCLGDGLVLTEDLFPVDGSVLNYIRFFRDECVLTGVRFLRDVLWGFPLLRDGCLLMGI